MPTPPLIELPASLSCHLGGRLRVRPEDFVVEEIPLYEPSGAGEHLMLLVEKRLLTTPMMVSRLARAFGVAEKDAGFAGYKDRRAVTRQWITLRGAAPQEEEVDLPGIRILRAELHQNRLRTGHLRGNRFRITVRETEPIERESFEAVVARLARDGMPNGFGPQRFGSHGDNHELGERLVEGDAEGFLRAVARERNGERGDVHAARAALREGAWSKAARKFPRDFRLERHLALAMKARDGDAQAAVGSVPAKLKSFLVSAWQSACFNRVLQRRLSNYGELLDGDVAMKHENGACFLVEDASVEAPRADAGEVSPTGPLPGLKMLRPQREPGALEQEVLSACGAFDLEPSTLLPAKTIQGARRALRVPVQELFAQPLDEGAVQFDFCLPRGAFATSLLAHFGIHERERGA